MKKIPEVQTASRELNQVQKNFKAAIEPLFRETAGQFAVTLTGCTASPSGIVYYKMPVQGGPVSLMVPRLIGTSATTDAKLIGLPSVLAPSAKQTVLIPISNGGSPGAGTLVIDVDGSMTLYVDGAGNVFSNTGSKGVFNCTVTYILDL